MEVTLREILALDNFKNVSVLAGKQGLNRIVENVYVMEVPDIKLYINRDGLLLTTLFPIIQNDKAMRSFIPDLVELGVAGVAIKENRYISKIPSYMLEQAEQHDFPILLLPENSNLSILTNDILSRLLGNKTETLEFRESISNQLHQFMLKGATIKELVEYVSNLTKEDILIINAQLQYVESSFSTEPVNFMVSDNIKDLTYKHAIMLRDNEDILVFNDRTYKCDEFIVYSIDTGDRQMGYLFILGKAEESFIIHTVIEQAIIFLAFLLQQQEMLIQTERNYLYSFVSAMINNQFKSKTELIDRAKVFSWEFHFPNIMMVIDIDNTGSYDKLTHMNYILNSNIIQKSIVKYCQVDESRIKSMPFNDYIVCFISVGLVNDLKAKLSDIGNELMYYLNKHDKVRISTSNIIYNIEDISTAYDEAMLTQEVLKDITNHDYLMLSYSELGLLKILHSVSNKEVLLEFVQDKMGNVLDDDSSKEMDLIDTLKILISNNMNMKKSAEELYIHYNSMRYRINKLKSLGIDVNNGKQMMEVSVALEILNYLG